MQVFIASNHWSAWRTSNLCYTIHSGFSPGPLPDILLFLVSWRSCSFGDVSLTTSYVPTVHRWHACWSGRTQGPSSGPGSEQGRSACQLSDCHHQREHSSTTPTSSPNAIVVNKELGHFAWASCPWVSSPTCSKVLYLVRGKTRFLVLVPLKPAVLFAQESSLADIFPSPEPPHGIWEWARSALLLLCSQGWLICAHSNRVSSNLLPREGSGQALLSAGVGEGPDSFPTLMNSEPAILSVTGCKECRRRERISP